MLACVCLTVDTVLLRRIYVFFDLIFSEWQPVRVLAEHERHYNGHRRHRARDTRPPIANPFVPADQHDEPRFGETTCSAV